MQYKSHIESIPILPKRILNNVQGEVWRISSNGYNFIKRPRNKFGYDSFSFASYGEAFKHAKFYRSLIKEGLYHPNTKIIICSDIKNNPTILVIMQELDTRISFEEFNKNRDNFNRIFKKYKLDEILDQDVNCEFNYGKDENGVVYYHDLHIIRNNNTSKIPKDYELIE